MGRLGRFFGSLRLTVAVLVALAGLFLLGLAVPQRAVLAPDMYREWRDASPRLVAALERLQLTDVHSSWLALVIWALFFANLTVVIGNRTPGIVKRVRIPGPPPRVAEVSGWPRRARLGVESTAALERARAFFAGAGYWVKAEEARFLAVRNRWSPIATIVFHGSFALLLVGGLISAATRFQATVRIAEGERFTGALQQYEARPRMPRWGDIPHEPFLVRKVSPSVEGDVPIGVRTEIVDGRGSVHAADINHPYRTGNRDFVLRDLGVAPLLVVRGADGRELDGAWVKLDVLMGKHDRFELAGLRFEADYFPDHVLEHGEDSTRSQEFLNPVLRLDISSAAGPLGRVRLRAGEGARVGDYVVAFSQQRFWVRFLVRKESGIPVVWVGLALACAALLFRLLLYRREYVVELERDGPAGTLAVAARAEFYRSLFEDEFEATMARVRTAVEAAPQAPPRPVADRAGASPP